MSEPDEAPLAAGAIAPDRWLWLALLGAGCAYLAGSLLLAWGTARDVPRPQWVAGVTFLQQGLTLAVIFVAATWSHEPWRAALRLQAGRRRWLLTGLLLPLPLFPLLLASAAIWSRLLKQFLILPVETTFLKLWQDADPATVILLIGSAVVLAPLVEELLFRRVVFALLAREGGYLAATMGTAAVFAACHFNLHQLLPLFLLGLALQLLVRQAGSLWPAIVMHAVHNAAALALICLMPAGRG